MIERISLLICIYRFIIEYKNVYGIGSHWDWYFSNVEHAQVSSLVLPVLQSLSISNY